MNHGQDTSKNLFELERNKHMTEKKEKGRERKEVKAGMRSCRVKFIRKKKR